MHRLDTQQSPLEIRHALNEAKALAAANIPIFVALPCPEQCPQHPADGSSGGEGGRGIGFHLPSGWQHTKPDPAIVDLWRPGWALCALGGHAADWLDVDPRNGGTEAANGLKQAGMWPVTYGEQATPSGGTHHLIAPLRTGKATPAPGIDLQGGRPDGTGVGFVFLSPTVRVSKIDGKPRPYRWVTPPDLELLAAEGPTDDSGAALALLVPKPPPGPQDGPFAQASSVKTPFTRAQAVEYCKPHMDALYRAQEGEINTRLNTAAKALSHFGEEFWTRADAHAWLHTALRSTRYDGVSWNAQDTIDSAYRSASSDWKAVHDPTPTTEATEERKTPLEREIDRQDLYDKAREHRRERDAQAEPEPVAELLSRMLTPAALEQLPNPKPLVFDLLDLDSESWIIGEPASFKSFVAIDIAAHVATGKTWQNKKVHQGPVVYVAAEGVRGIKLRAQAWAQTYGVMSENIHFLPEAIQVTNQQGWATLVEACKQIKPVLIVLDTQARITVGLEENSARDMGVLVDAVRRLRVATGACVLVVHHIGRNGTNARGSSALDGAQDTEIRVERPNPRSLVAKISLDKQKDNNQEIDFNIKLEIQELGFDEHTGRKLTSLAVAPPEPFGNAYQPVPEWEDDTQEVQGKVLHVMRTHSDSDGASRSQIWVWLREHADAGQMNIITNYGTLDTALVALKTRGLITRSGGAYVLAE